ncbi:MAG: hypothetical protein HY908_07505 [Myxococcales bacterium]|nr:hypothetical protein [Myxococcales bacterium]
MGAPLGWHIGLRLADDRVLAATPGERRLLARAVLQHGERARLVAFRAVDTHLHAELLCERDEVAHFARGVGRAMALALRRRAASHTSFVKPLADQRHGQSTLRYILAQERHHGLDSDPFHEASNLPDLLGLRVVGPYTARVLAEAFPRIGRDELAAALGLGSGAAAALGLCRSGADAGPDADPQDLGLLEDAAAAAFALTELRGRTPEAVAARHAAVHAAGCAVPVRQMAELLGAGERTIERLRAQPCAPGLVAAVRGQWRLRAGSRGVSRGVRPPPSGPSEPFDDEGAPWRE